MRNFQSSQQYCSYISEQSVLAAADLIFLCLATIYANHKDVYTTLLAVPYLEYI